MAGTADTGEVIRHDEVHMSMFQCPGDGEEQHEKEESPPVHLPFDIMPCAVAAEDHDDSGADQRGDQEDAVLADAEPCFKLVVHGDGADRDEDQGESLLVGHFDHRSERQIARKTLLETDIELRQVFAVIPDGQRHRGGERQQHDRERIAHEIAESQPAFGADVDADGIAHHGACASHVGAQNADQDIGDRVELEAVADLKHQRCNEDNRSDLIHRTRQQSRCGGCDRDEFHS